MKKKIIRIITITAMLSLLFMITVLPASAQVYDNSDIFLKIDGIEGESNNSSHDRWIDVTYFMHGALQSIQTGSPDAAGRGVHAPIVFKHTVDKATPKLQEYCMTGRHIKVAEMHFCCAIAGKQEVVYKVKFEGLKIVKTEVELEELEEGKTQTVETVTFLANKETWTKISVGLDNLDADKTEASFDQTKKASMFDSNAGITITVITAVVIVLILAAVIFFVKKNKKVSASDAKTELTNNDKT